MKESTELNMYNKALDDVIPELEATLDSELHDFLDIGKVMDEFRKRIGRLRENG